MAKKRNRPSSIDRLPEDIRQEIMRLRFTDNLHFDEIMDRLRGKVQGRDGVEMPSRGALGRHLLALQHEIDEKVSRELKKVSPLLGYLDQMMQALFSDLLKAGAGERELALAELLKSSMAEMLMHDMAIAAQVANGDLEPDDPQAARMGVLDRTRIVQMLRRLADMRILQEREADRKADRADKKAKEKAEAERAAAVEEAGKQARQRGVTKETFEQMRRFLLGEQA